MNQTLNEIQKLIKEEILPTANKIPAPLILQFIELLQISKFPNAEIYFKNPLNDFKPEKLIFDKTQTDGIIFSNLILKLTPSLPPNYIYNWTQYSLSHFKNSILELIPNPEPETENKFPVIYTEEMIFIFAAPDEIKNLSNLTPVVSNAKVLKSNKRYWFYKKTKPTDFNPYNLKINGEQLLKVIQNPTLFKNDFQLFDRIFNSYFFRKEKEQEKEQFKNYFFTLYFFTLSPFFFESIIWNRGDGANGKTSFLLFLKNKIVGEHLTHQINPSTFKNSSFAFDGIQNALISWIEEMPQESNPEILKQWSSPSLAVDRKNKTTQTIKSTHQPVLNTNCPTLKVNDNSNGTFRRFFPIIWKYRRDNPEHLAGWNTPQEWKEFQESNFTPLIFIYHCFEAIEKTFQTTDKQINTSQLLEIENFFPEQEAQARENFLNKNDSLTHFLKEDENQNLKFSILQQITYGKPINENQIIELYRLHTIREEIPEKFKLNKKNLIQNIPPRIEKLTGAKLEIKEIENPTWKENPTPIIPRIIKQFQRIDFKEVKNQLNKPVNPEEIKTLQKEINSLIQE